MEDFEMPISTLIITACPESNLMDQAMRYCHFTVLKKPVQPVDLGRAVDGIMRRCRTGAYYSNPNA